MKFETLQRVGEKLRLIDQTRLPGDIVYNDYDDYHEIIKAIQRLEVRGAPAIGIAAAYALAVGVVQTGQYEIKQIEAIGRTIKDARPTAVNLAWAIDRVLSRLKQETPGSLDAVLKLLWDEAEIIHEEDRLMCTRIGEHGASLINAGDAILTHCNAGALATGGIGTALGVIYACHYQGKNISVYADETRPLLQGARLTSWELMQEGIDVTLICDSMAAVLMTEGRINHVVVGADRIAKNGDTANKIGTYGLAVHAKYHNVPFYVAAPSSTFDEFIETGRGIPVEQRAAEEITEGFGHRTAPDNVQTFSPAFDITPNELVSAFITDTGIRPGGRGR
ncbi:MAG: S-methyl-5-thioribose-1-phosphate isomerase [candidate division Zixibacteria bacterium]|nr:S-methyl-5-thioribose-1-phosphate isomerase [candidate division Zixibacteria bacterium]